MLRRIPILLAALALITAACGGDESADTSAPPQSGPETTAPVTTTPVTTTPETTTPATTTPVTTSPPGATAAVVLTPSSLGDILTDQDGNTLYLFVPDDQGPSVCNDGCAAAWPPLPAGAEAGDGIDAALLGTATRDDGTEQMTYNGWPLYYYASDSAPGDVTGQGVNDVWYVLDANGDAVGS